MDDPYEDMDLCRVCRYEGGPTNPLFHPCVCAGSIKYIHQDCLIRWLSHRHSDLCEVCHHYYSFSNVYSTDMPNSLPFIEVYEYSAEKLLERAKHYTFHILLPFLWLFIIPSMGFKFHKCLFNGTIDPLLSLASDIWSFEKLVYDAYETFPTILIVLAILMAVLVLNGHAMLANNIRRELPFNGRLLEEEELGANHEDEGNEENVNQNPINRIRVPLEEILGLREPNLLLEHICLVIFLTLSGIVVFLFFPYHLGKFVMNTITLPEEMVPTHFERSVLTIIGYCLTAIVLFFASFLVTFTGSKPLKRAVDTSYNIVKALIMLKFLIGAIPLLCGCWMDICSDAMFNLNIEERIQNYHKAPNSFVVMHWIFGFVYLYFFGPITDIVQVVCRPGILWFLKHIFQFNDTQLLIKGLERKSLFYYYRKCALSILAYGTLIFLLVWIPLRIIKFILPSFLPYSMPTDNNYIDEWSMFMRLILVLIAEYKLMAKWIKKGVEIWCNHVSNMLGIKSYLLGDETNEEELQIYISRNYQSYTRPTYFVLRLIALVFTMFVTLVVLSLLLMTIPVSCYRLIMLLLPKFQPTPSPYRQIGMIEIYFVFMNVVMWRSVLRLVIQEIRKLLLSIVLINRYFKLLFINGYKLIIIFAVMFCIITQLFGLVFQLTMVVPFTVPMHQSPVIWELKDFGLHLICMLLFNLLFIFGTTCPLKQAMSRVYTDGLENLSLKFVMNNIAMPIICVFSLLLTVPYILAYSIIPLFISSQWSIQLVPRIIYPIFILIVVVVKLIYVLSIMYKRLTQHILNERYKVGLQLLNYYPPTNAINTNE